MVSSGKGIDRNEGGEGRLPKKTYTRLSKTEEKWLGVSLEDMKTE